MIEWPMRHEPKYESAYLQVVKSLLRREERPLAELLHAVAPPTPSDRIVFLKQTARHLAGRIVAVGGREQRGHFSLRRNLQRLSLRSCSAELLAAMASRRRDG